MLVVYYSGQYTDFTGGTIVFKKIVFKKKVSARNHLMVSRELPQKSEGTNLSAGVAINPMAQQAGNNFAWEC